MNSVNVPVISMPQGAARRRRLAQTVEARRKLARGRAWINGREIGGTDPRWAHLSVSHD